MKTWIVQMQGNVVGEIAVEAETSDEAAHAAVMTGLGIIDISPFVQEAFVLSVKEEVSESS